MTGLAIYERGGRRLSFFDEHVDAVFITRLAFRLSQGDETPGEPETLADFLALQEVHAVAVNHLEVRKEPHPIQHKGDRP